MQGGRVEPSSLPTGPNGRALCRWCNVEVPENRQTFCSKECVIEWKVRMDKAFLRRMVWKRDRSVCAICATNCDKWRRELRREWKGILALSSPSERQRREKGFRAAHPYFFQRETFWDADHVVPVVEGGGEAGLDNIQTLCLFCHRKKTSELNSRRARERRQSN